MDRLSKFLLIPTGFATLAGFGLGQMTNVLQPYWPDAPHWVFALLFWSGAALVVVPFPTWLIWLGWKNRYAYGTRSRMILGVVLLICGCAISIVGLSIIAAGDKNLPNRSDAHVVSNLSRAEPVNFPITQPATSPKPHYDQVDINQMLGALRDMRAIMAILPTYDETEAIRWSWSKTLKRDGGVAEMSSKMKDIGARVLAGMNALDRLTEIDYKHYSSELHPVAFTSEEQQSIGSFVATSSQLASDLGDLAKAQNVDAEKWTLQRFNEWQNQLNPKYIEWLGQANSRISAATKQYREWQNP
ncbi:hypothetical protein [Bradyrhizobium symbiodeficiens]|uniref:hypothetical protein n=1 Tax=Bradyrhizobium symbiodeficiens TaxID=1404367 RepID=UPI00140FD974|nr:hypothetical protein [Bradyrhizobium symbiodeficiens]QIP01521.1 hypothetical protein HAU86_17775 [Bradyrhizobium symbiodeficiens]